MNQTIPSRPNIKDRILGAVTSAFIAWWKTSNSTIHIRSLYYIDPYGIVWPLNHSAITLTGMKTGVDAPRDHIVTLGTESASAEADKIAGRLPLVSPFQLGMCGW